MKKNILNVAEKHLNMTILNISSTPKNLKVFNAIGFVPFQMLFKATDNMHKNSSKIGVYMRQKKYDNMNFI